MRTLAAHEEHGKINFEELDFVFGWTKIEHEDYGSDESAEKNPVDFVTIEKRLKAPSEIEFAIAAIKSTLLIVQ